MEWVANSHAMSEENMEGLSGPIPGLRGPVLEGLRLQAMPYLGTIFPNSNALSGDHFPILKKSYFYKDI